MAGEASLGHAVSVVARSRSLKARTNADLDRIVVKVRLRFRVEDPTTGRTLGVREWSRTAGTL